MFSEILFASPLVPYILRILRPERAVFVWLLALHTRSCPLGLLHTILLNGGSPVPGTESHLDLTDHRDITDESCSSAVPPRS